METRKFKTTAKCQGCVAKIKPFLNQIISEDQWAFDLSGTDKILTVQSDCPEEKLFKLYKKQDLKLKY